MISNNLIVDLSSLTQIQKSLLDKIVKISCLDICQNVLEGVKQNDISSIDIGIGKLSILVQDDEIKYKFIPSKQLEQLLVEAISTGQSPLVQALEDSLSKKILGMYKELL